MQRDLSERNFSCLLSELLQIDHTKKLRLLLFAKRKENGTDEASAAKKYLC